MIVRSIRSKVVTALALAGVAGAVSAQPPAAQQVLKDVWVATATDLFDVNYDEDPSVLEAVPGAYAVGATRSLAFEPPQLGNGGAARGLVAVDGTELLRFTDEETTGLLDAGEAPTSMTMVNAVAVADDGTVLFSGFSRPKRVYELWAFDPTTQQLKLRATGTPQVTDAVYLSAEDVTAAGLPGGGGGVLAVSAKAVMFFPEPSSGGWLSSSPPLNNPTPLRDGSSLGLKGNTQLLSVDLVRATAVLMLVTSDRKLLTAAVSGGLPVSFVPTLPKPATCNLKTQRLLVRNARGGGDAASVVADACGQVLRYDFTSANAPYSETITPAPAGLMAVAVGEGNLVTCLANEPLCTLTEGLDTKLQTTVDKNLLVRQYDNLCDPRVLGCAATGEVDADNVLNFNSLLPQAVQDALEELGVTITIPAYMFAAGPNGRFGAVIVQTDDAGTAAQATVELDVATLLGFELGTRSTQKGDPFVRGAPDTTILNLLNQDIVAYAPDNPTYPTVGGLGFEATPVTTGSYNPLVGGLRGFSVVLYGFQHDLKAATDRPRRDPQGGLPSPLAGGSPPLCNLYLGSQQFIAVDSPERFFINLAACLFADQEELLSSSIIPPGALSATDRSTLLSRLANVKDKLIKALNASGPNTGSTDFQAVLTQLGHYDAAVLATPFYPMYNVYKNELIVRSDAFEFILMERAYPSLPIGGF